MWKIIFLIILILGCDKMATKYNTYSSTDPNPDNIIDAIDMDGKGLIRLSLTEWSTTAKPNVAQESIVENGGSRFKTETTGGDVISLTDPTTSTTVVDGPVYIVLNGDSGSGGYGIYAFTATVPTWSDEKQGYYLTGLYSDYRAVGGCQLDSGLYTEKFIFKHRDFKYPQFLELTEKIDTEKSTTSLTLVDVSPSFSKRIYVNAGELYEIIYYFEMQCASNANSQLVINGSLSTALFNAVNNTKVADVRYYRLCENTIILDFISDNGGNAQFLAKNIIYITQPGFLLLKEKIKTTNASNPCYIRNRNIYIKKINNIDVGI